MASAIEHLENIFSDPKRLRRIDNLLAGVYSSKYFLNVLMFYFDGFDDIDLQKWQLETVYPAACRAACDGLLIDGEHAIITPRRGIARYQRMYKGSAAMCWRSGLVRSISSNVYYQAEIDRKFFTCPPNSPPKHDQTLQITSSALGRPLGAYSIIETTAGGCVYSVMNEAEIMRHASAGSNIGKYNIKNPDFGEWWKKTAFISASKLAPLGKSGNLFPAQERNRTYALSAQANQVPINLVQNPVDNVSDKAGPGGADAAKEVIQKQLDAINACNTVDQFSAFLAELGGNSDISLKQAHGLKMQAQRRMQKLGLI